MSSNTQALQLLKTRITDVKYQRVLSTNYDNEDRRNTKDTWKKVERTEFKKNLSSYEQITVNTPDFKNAIIFDVDNPDTFELPDIAPTWQTYNKTNNKHHVGYILETPRYTKTPEQKHNYKTIIAPMLSTISFLINSDVNYKNTTTKNPFNKTSFVTKEGGNTLKDVWELLGLYRDDISEISTTEANIKKDGKYLSDKYKRALIELREHSQMNAAVYFDDVEEYKNVMYIKAEIMAENGYTKKEVMRVCKDVIDYMTSYAEALRSRQSKRSKIANKKRWGDTVEQNKINITNAIIDILARGFKPTIKNISMCVNLSEETLKRAKYSPFIKSEKLRLISSF